MNNAPCLGSVSIEKGAGLRVDEPARSSGGAHSSEVQASKKPVKMSDNEEKEVPDVEVDYSKYDEDSVPAPEKPIEHTHEGRPDLDYDDTPVGPAPTECTEEEPEKNDD